VFIEKKGFVYFLVFTLTLLTFASCGTLFFGTSVPPGFSPRSTLSFPFCGCFRFGPMFGAGADLCITDNCNKEKSSYSNLPYSYASAQATSDLLMGEYYFTIEEYEVFALKGDNSLEKE